MESAHEVPQGAVSEGRTKLLLVLPLALIDKKTLLNA